MNAFLHVVHYYYLYFFISCIAIVVEIEIKLTTIPKRFTLGPLP